MTPQAPLARELDAPILRVTLLEDRAQVRRSGCVRIAAGNHRLRVRGVSPAIADRSLVARSPAGVRVHELSVARRWRVGSSELPAERAQALAERRAIGDDLARLQGELALLRERSALADRALGLVVDGIDRALPYAEEFPAVWSSDVRDFARAAREAEEAVATCEQAIADLEARLAEHDLRNAPSAASSAVLEAELVVDLVAEADAEVELALDYVVPCALWRPAHRATLVDAEVRFEYEAAVWQATGEDWVDVELLFSTARPTQRSEPPRLEDDLLRVRRRQSKVVDVAVREEVIASTGEGRDETLAELPGVDDGGEARTLSAPTRASIPADGRLHRVPLLSFASPAEVERVCRPELSPMVHSISRQTNHGPQPILAGPVELARESGLVGWGEVGFVAPGERFLLGWGAEDAVRVLRAVEEREDEGFLARKRRRRRTVTLRLCNQEPLPVAFRLEERIPVSEVDEVEVAIDPEASRPPARADEEGIVAWDIQLPPRGAREVVLTYTISASRTVRGL